MLAGDPSKKFDVVFSVDMKELLTAVGATPRADSRSGGDGREEPQPPGESQSLCLPSRMMGGSPE